MKSNAELAVAKFNSKTKMIDAIGDMLNIVDRYYGQNLQNELERLLSTLESESDDEISEVIADTVDGCATAIDQLRSLNWALERFEQAQHDYEKTTDDAIDEFENSL
jgi:hypothetical protein